MKLKRDKVLTSWYDGSYFSFFLKKYKKNIAIPCAFYVLENINILIIYLNLTVTPAAEVDLRMVTYEEMLEDWFSLSEEPATPEGKANTNVESLAKSYKLKKKAAPQ